MNWVAAFSGVLWLALAGCEAQSDREVRSHLEGRGRLLLVDGQEGRWVGRGTEGVPRVDAPRTSGALAGSDPGSLLRSMELERVSGLLMTPRLSATTATNQETSLEGQLALYRPVRGLRAVFLEPRVGLFVPHRVTIIDPAHAMALATVARAILAGTRPPHTSSFPEPLRVLEHVEVMVMLRGTTGAEGGRPRLWRSARDSSIAAALITAATVGRQRWQERQASIGGPIEGAIDLLDVEVSLLEQDGTLLSRELGFIDRAVAPGQGIGFEQRGNWQYVLPEVVTELGSATAAYRKLFSEQGLPTESFTRADLRLYRLSVTPLGRSAAPSRSGSPSTGR